MPSRVLIVAALLSAATLLPHETEALQQANAKRCADIKTQRTIIAEEIARLRRQIDQTTVEAFAASLRRRVSELEDADAELLAESTGCGSASTTSGAPPPGPPPGRPPSPPIPDSMIHPAPAKSPAPAAAPAPATPAAAASMTKSSVSTDLCTLLPTGFIVGDGNEPGNPTKKSRPGVPRFCDGAGSADGPHYIAISISAFGDRSAASSEVEGYRKLPDGTDASATSEFGDVALTSTQKKDHPAGGAFEEHMVAFARGKYFVYIQASGPKIPEATKIEKAIDATLKQWTSQ